MKNLFQLLRKYWRFYIVATALALVLIAINVLSGLMLPNIMANLVDIGVVQSDVPYILRGGLIMLGWAALGVGASIGESYMSSRIAMGMGRDIRRDLFSKITSLPVYNESHLGTSTLITRTTNDVEQIERVIHALIHLGLMAPITFVGAATMSIRANPSLSFIILVAIPLLVGSVMLILKLAMPYQRLMQESLDRLSRTTLEGIAGVRVVRAYNKQNFMRILFTQAAQKLKDASVTSMRLMGLMMPLTMLVINIAIVATFWLGANLVNSGELMVGSLLAVVQYAMQMLMSIMFFSMVLAFLPRAAASGERIAQVFSTASERDSSKGSFHKTHAASPESGMHIQFENVTFSFPHAQEPAIKEVSFEILPGEKIALVGPTGSGKSTVAALILGFIFPTKGQVLINGESLSKLELESHRARIGYVPQTTNLFSGTVESNVLYGAPEASASKVRGALIDAKADDFVPELADGSGLDMAVVRGGQNFSGGQRQRLSIARALVRDADLYLFDDPMSALDFSTEAKVQEAIKRRTQDATTIMVTQRAHIAQQTDRILVLDNGKLIGNGSHDELYDSCGFYQDLVTSQSEMVGD